MHTGYFGHFVALELPLPILQPIEPSGPCGSHVRMHYQPVGIFGPSLSENLHTVALAGESGDQLRQVSLAWFGYDGFVYWVRKIG